MIWRRHKQPASPESSPGGPVYDATIDPYYLDDGGESNLTLRLRSQLALHHSANRLEPAPVLEGGRIAAAFALLGVQRDVAAKISERRWEHPFPGVPLGPLPSFGRTPEMEPISAPNLLTHHSHEFESLRRSRARFGRR